MAIIQSIKVNADTAQIESNVNLLHQANHLYMLLEEALPPGKLKDEALQFTAQKREEYIQGIANT